MLHGVASELNINSRQRGTAEGSMLSWVDLHVGAIKKKDSGVVSHDLALHVAALNSATKHVMRSLLCEEDFHQEHQTAVCSEGSCTEVPSSGKGPGL